MSASLLSQVVGTVSTFHGIRHDAQLVTAPTSQLVANDRFWPLAAILRTLAVSALPSGLVGGLLNWCEEVLEDAARAEVNLGVDLHAGKDVQSNGTVRPVLYCSGRPGKAEKLCDLEFHFFEARFRNPLFDVQDLNTHDLIFVVEIEDDPWLGSKWGQYKISIKREAPAREKLHWPHLSERDYRSTVLEETVYSMRAPESATTCLSLS